MADLSTRYMGLSLDNPVIVSSSGITGSPEGVRRCAESGAGAVVLKSMFEEIIVAESDALEQDLATYDHPEALDYIRADIGMRMGPRPYLQFIRDVKKIVAAVPRKRQTLFFSATMPQAVSGLAGEMLRDPVEVAVTPQATTVERVDQSVHFVRAADKRDLLTGILRDPALERTIVFTRTKHRANRVAEALGKAGIPAEAIHGNKSQGARQRALEGFRRGRVRVLVATDIAARGIDVDGVTHVINFELPNVAEDYVHRIGRTARAGASGAAISLCDPEEQVHLRGIEKLIKRDLDVAGGTPARHVPANDGTKQPPRRNRGRKPQGQRPRRAA